MSRFIMASTVTCAILFSIICARNYVIAHYLDDEVYWLFMNFVFMETTALQLYMSAAITEFQELPVEENDEESDY